MIYVYSGPILEVPSDVLVPNEVRPENATGDRPDVKVEVVDLVVTRRVTEDIQSYKSEGCLVPLAIDTDVLALHEPVVDRRKHVGLDTRRGVGPPARA